ncbi:MAG: hypothetical protein KC468_31580, partial [Myxococcales bacterium]|nr:hypothetical protein [Myxococcales bacterium]
MAEPITIQLTFTTPLNGTGDIALERNNLTVTNGRLYTATVPSGSRLSPDLFSLVSAGSVKSVAISASTHCPTDVARVYVGSTVRTEIDLRGRHQTVTFGPGEQLAFVTHGPTTVTLVVNELSEAEHAARVEPVIAFPSRIRLSRSDGSGFAPGGVLNPALTWNEAARMFTGDVSTNGSIPLEVLDPRESRFAGLTTRVRLSGFDGELASVGRTDAVNGETHFVAQVAAGQWSPPFQLSHDDLLALETPALRAGCTSCVADIELLPGRDAAVVVSTAAASAGSTVAAGTVPRSAWIDRSVNAAGATPREDGWLLWTHAITGNPNAAGNKGFHGTGAGNKGILSTSYADELPLGDLQSLVIRYASLTAGNDS